MKFYQTVAFVMLSIVSTTMLFGSKETSELFVSEDVFDIIDHYCDNEYRCEETAHISDKELTRIDLSDHELLGNILIRHVANVREMSQSELKKFIGKKIPIEVKLRHLNHLEPYINNKKISIFSSKRIDIFSDGDASLICSLEMPKPVCVVVILKDQRIMASCSGHIYMWKLRKNTKMIEVYPDGKVKARKDKYIPPEHDNRATVSVSQYSMSRAIPVIVVASIVIILLKLYFNQMVSKW